MVYTIKVNAVDHSVDVDGDTPLLWVLRDVLGMTGTKFGCGKALCGACTVLINGIAARSCITTIDSVGTAAITTIEAIGTTPAIANPARSCPLLRCWRASQIPAIPTSMMPWQVSSAAAAPTSGFAKPSRWLRSQPAPMNREVEDVSRSIGSFCCR